MNHMPDRPMAPHLTALRCMFLVAMHHGVQVPPERFADAEESDPVGSVMRIMRDMGLTSKILKNRGWKDLSSLGSAFPVMAEQKAGNWVIIISAFTNPDGEPMVAQLDPRVEASGISLISQDKFSETWTGRLLLCKRKFKLIDESRPFGLQWFMPEISKQWRFMRDVAIATLMSQLISFATPLCFQIIIDKVIPHQSYQTLVAVVLAFIMTIIFEGLFAYTRQYLMIFATNKIDARLASRAFEHMLRLPMTFFEGTTAGVLLRNMQQTESIRQFLTGRLFQTLLDVSALPLLLIGLTIYSGMLTAVVLAFSAIIAAIIAIMIPTFKRYLEDLYGAEGARQSDLVETIHGMRAVKSLALEPLRMKSWDAKVAHSTRKRSTVGVYNTVAVVLTQALQSMMTISILGIGAMLVFDGSLSMGALVAFNMLSARVTGPLLQIVALINEYQQTALAITMLGKVMDHPPERDPNQRGIRPMIRGELDFQQVSFRYGNSVTPALDRVTFRIEEGQMIGVVGRSGSGKTTMTRLIQGIHTAQEGLIKLNGADIRNIDLAHLRRSIGVVLQENILFRGSIRDNISAGKPDATLDEIMEAARLAGADEFIDRLPLSFDSLIEEGASNFSGGQRQRLAIARALLVQPRLLLLDEATSALDPESEAIIQNNLSEIARDRTMIIVSHRLSSLVNSDKILVLDKGQVVEFAPHTQLLQTCDVYRHLWDQQTRHVRT
jgi:subfamily B ATP-binding cassette protein HlyB/CyaB